MNLDLVKKLRDITGAGMVDVKQALTEANDDEAKAIELLRMKGQKIAAKRGGRETHEGVIEAYVHSNGKVASVVAVACETDFVARTDDFKSFVHEVALHVAATAPQYLNPEEVPVDIIEQEKKIYREQLKTEGKPEAMWDKIIEGKLQKFYTDNCLLKQKFIKDDSITIEQMITALIGRIGENIQITKFAYITI